MRCGALMLVCMFAGCHSPSAPSPPAARVPRDALDVDYSKWPGVTKTPHPVSPPALMFCAPPSTTQQLENDRKSHGPHANSAIVVRVSPTGREEFTSRKPVPVGTVVVKEKYPHYFTNASPTAVAFMIKREPGYDPEHDDWEYAYEDRPSEGQRKITRGKIESCINCHRLAKVSDYLDRRYLKASE